MIQEYEISNATESYPNVKITKNLTWQNPTISKHENWIPELKIRPNLQNPISQDHLKIRPKYKKLNSRTLSGNLKSGIL